MLHYASKCDKYILHGQLSFKTHRSRRLNEMMTAIRQIALCWFVCLVSLYCGLYSLIIMVFSLYYITTCEAYFELQTLGEARD